MNAKKLIFGCGYLGMRVAQRWIHRGDAVAAVTRSTERGEVLSRLGIEPLIADVTDPESLAKALPGKVSTVLYAVGYDRPVENRKGGPTMRTVYVDGLMNVLNALPSHVERILYVSSTGVYGNFGGEWIDEMSECCPDREGGKICLDAEETLEEHPLGDRSIILRMAGIYGPGRIPRRKEILAGEPIAAPEQGWLNLIHVDDAANIVLAAETIDVPPPRLFLATDGNPVQRGEYFQELARILSAPSPRFTTPAPNSPAMERAASNKRIRNAKLVAELAVQFAYPTYREGLAAIVEQERNDSAAALDHRE